MQFLNPNVFYMMLIPLILFIVLILTNKENMQGYFSKEVLDKLLVGGKTIGKTTRNSLLFFTLICFITALSRPVIDQKEQELKQNLIPIVIALDVSKSMSAADIYPNRITLAKQKLKQIIELSPNSMIGVLLFAKDSFILSPVTEDFISLKFIIENLDTNLDFVNGSNIFATLEATDHMLLDFKVKNLIILSDGGNDNSYEKEIQFAKDNNIAVYSIGIATANGAPIPQKQGYLTDKKGNIVTVKLNESIKNLSLQSGGGYIDFSLDNNDVKAIINQINKQSKKEELNTQKVKIYTELFYYPLVLGLFVLLISLSSLPKIKFKRSKENLNMILLLTFLSFYLLPTQSEASFFEFENIKKANSYYENKEYTKASDEYRKISQTPQSYYNLGNSLYKDGKYKEAIDIYSKIVTKDKELESKKLHNIGNSYVNSKMLEKAKEFYEKALKLKQDKQTQENLDMVNKELEKKKEKDKKDNKDKKENKDKKQDKKQDKKEKQKDKDKNSKKKDEKDKKENKPDKEDKDKKENQSEASSEKDKDDKKSSKKDGKNKSQSKKQQKKQDISDMEEKKWMKMLNDQKTPILLRKVETKKESKSDDSQPW